VDATRSVDLLGTFDAPAVVDKDTVIVTFTEADTGQKYFPGAEVYTDLFFHATHTGATLSRNAVRIAGITSGTKLVAVKVCGYINECPFSSILNGVIYAANNGADVINMSLGGPFTKAGNGRFVGLLDKVFNYARSKGVTIVVSAGNDTTDLDHDGNSYQTFCNTPSVICVAATGPTSDANATNSTPHVAGTAALLVSILGRNPSQIKARIQQSADNLAGNGTSPFYGKGRLNVARAVGAIP